MSTAPQVIQAGMAVGLRHARAMDRTAKPRSGAASISTKSGRRTGLSHGPQPAAGISLSLSLSLSQSSRGAVDRALRCPRMEGRSLPRWITFGAGVLVAVFGIFPLLFQAFGWSNGHVFLGSLLAGVILALGLALADRAFRRTRTGRRAFVVGAATASAGVLAAVALPTLTHVTLNYMALPEAERWAYLDTLDIPVLADDEPVRGTGCGGHPDSTRVSDTSIPDGYWYGTIQRGDDAGELKFDLICVYASDVDARENPAYQTLQREGRVTTVTPTRGVTWIMLDRTNKTRDVPLASNFRYREAAWLSGTCVIAGGTKQLAFGVQAWLVIRNGRATLAVRQCNLRVH